jgi:hypothetical protein
MVGGLRELELGGNRLGHRVCTAAARGLLAREAMHTAALEGFAVRGGVGGECECCADPMKALTANLSNHEVYLDHLGLGSIDLGDEGVCALVRGCVGNRHLTSLDLSDNRVGAVGAWAVASHLGPQVCPNMPALTQVDLSSNPLADAHQHVRQTETAATVAFGGLDTTTFLSRACEPPPIPLAGKKGKKKGKAHLKAPRSGIDVQERRRVLRETVLQCRGSRMLSESAAELSLQALDGRVLRVDKASGRVFDGTELHVGTWDAPSRRVLLHAAAPPPPRPAMPEMTGARWAQIQAAVSARGPRESQLPEGRGGVAQPVPALTLTMVDVAGAWLRAMRLCPKFRLLGLSTRTTLLRSDELMAMAEAVLSRLVLRSMRELEEEELAAHAESDDGSDPLPSQRHREQLDNADEEEIDPEQLRLAQVLSFSALSDSAHSLQSLSRARSLSVTLLDGAGGGAGHDRAAPARPSHGHVRARRRRVGQRAASCVQGERVQGARRAKPVGRRHYAPADLLGGGRGP